MTTTWWHGGSLQNRDFRVGNPYRKILTEIGSCLPIAQIGLSGVLANIELLSFFSPNEIPSLKYVFLLKKY